MDAPYIDCEKLRSTLAVEQDTLGPATAKPLLRGLEIYSSVLLYLCPYVYIKFYHLITQPHMDMPALGISSQTPYMEALTVSS